MNYFPLDDDHKPDPDAESSNLSLDALLQLPACYEARPVAPHLGRVNPLSVVLHRPDDAMEADTRDRPAAALNQRKFSRCEISQERPRALLTLKGRRIDCRLVEMSIGGFGVITAESLQLHPGTTGSLRAPGLNYIVGVTHQERCPEGVYIGLQQVEEVLEPGRLPGDPSPVVRYLLAGVAGFGVIAMCYMFMFNT
jgi:hypothetical protein